VWLYLHSALARWQASGYIKGPRDMSEELVPLGTKAISACCYLIAAAAAQPLAAGSWMCSTATPAGSSRALLGASLKTENRRRGIPSAYECPFDRARRARSSGALRLN
jgi:hypothetical protein